MSEHRYVEIPGSKTHELPPLLLHTTADSATDLTSVMLEAEDMLASTDADREILEQRKLDLALQLTEQYKGLLSHWYWGDSVVEWIRQCEITFESEGVLRKLLHPDVWPHASRASFVELLRENRPLEIRRLAQFHELVRVARVAVLTPELTTAIGIDRFAKRQAAFGGGMVENRSHLERSIFSEVPDIGKL